MPPVRLSLPAKQSGAIHEPCMVAERLQATPFNAFRIASPSERT